MEFIRSFKKLSKKDVGIAGGKGAQLGEMTKAGMPVPEGFVVLTDSFDSFIKENRLNEKIKAELKNADIEKIDSVKRASKNIQSAILKGLIPAGIKKSILNEYGSIKLKLVAVRSSATAEDAADASWAGELDTYVNIDKQGLLDAVKKCWASLFTERAITYAKHKKIDEGKISVAVVVQKMVQSEISGVCFTVNPVTNNQKQIMIEAGFGLGESVVAGTITPDKYIVNKEEMFIEEIIVNKQETMISKKGMETIKSNVSKERQEKQKLEGKQIVELAELCKKIESHYGKPQDIEFAFEKNKLYILQARPVTTI